ncbi:MAG: class I SAM-dependent methyltransferase [Bdellovibrionales bacterium]|nr:class I SAM-dependent methyltransferase [Bdellovibrionales bacterium]
MEEIMSGSNLYSIENYAEGYPDGIQFHYWQQARNQILVQVLGEIPGGPGRIFEIGCGRGFNIQYLRDHGLDCTGSELAPAPILPEVAAFAVSSQDVFELPADRRAGIQTVLLLDVIEHIQDAPGFLEKVRHAFPDLLNLILMVPARSEIWSNHDEHYGHFRRYDLALLKQNAEAAGFVEKSSGYLFRILYLAARILLKVQKKRDVLIRAPSPAVRWLHSVIARILVLESRLLPGFLYGSSAIGIYRVKK